MTLEPPFGLALAGALRGRRAATPSPRALDVLALGRARARFDARASTWSAADAPLPSRLPSTMATAAAHGDAAQPGASPAGPAAARAVATQAADVAHAPPAPTGSPAARPPETAPRAVATPAANVAHRPAARPESPAAPPPDAAAPRPAGGMPYVWPAVPGPGAPEAARPAAPRLGAPEPVDLPAPRVRPRDAATRSAPGDAAGLPAPRVDVPDGTRLAAARRPVAPHGGEAPRLGATPDLPVPRRPHNAAGELPATRRDDARREPVSRGAPSPPAAAAILPFRAPDSFLRGAAETAERVARATLAAHEKPHAPEPPPPAPAVTLRELTRDDVVRAIAARIDDLARDDRFRLGELR